LVRDRDIAYHTRGQNDDSLGIGLLHKTGAPYVDAQLASLRLLVARISQEHDILLSSVMPASAVDPKKKSDIGKHLPELLSAVSSLR
jgi:N-acetyl-anhydromuramyl-L-alanine amidase AmpD